MQNTSNYNISIHNECVDDLINPSTTGTTPNSKLRAFILDWVKSGKEVKPTRIHQAWLKTGNKVSRPRISQLLRQMGVVCAK